MVESAANILVNSCPHGIRGLYHRLNQFDGEQGG
jgi:hypothetical protein